MTGLSLSRRDKGTACSMRCGDILEYHPLRAPMSDRDARTTASPQNTSPLTAEPAGRPCGSHLSLAHPPQHMRQASGECRCKPHPHRDHGQHRRARETVMLESRGRIDEHYAIDGECRGGDCANQRYDARDDGQHSALLTNQRGAIIRRAATPRIGPSGSEGRLLRRERCPRGDPANANRRKRRRARHCGRSAILRSFDGCQLSTRLHASAQVVDPL